MNYWGPILEKIDNGSQTAITIAAIVGCSPRTVRHYRKIRGTKPTPPQCQRCQLLPDTRNPLDETGLCLWCRLELAGVRLLNWHESGAAAKYYKERGIK